MSTAYFHWVRIPNASFTWTVWAVLLLLYLLDDGKWENKHYMEQEFGEVDVKCPCCIYHKISCSINVKWKLRLNLEMITAKIFMFVNACLKAESLLIQIFCRKCYRSKSQEHALLDCILFRLQEWLNAFTWHGTGKWSIWSLHSSILVIWDNRGHLFPRFSN